MTGDAPIHETHEARQTLWLLAVSPSIWAAHFLLSYVTAAVWIEKVGGRDAPLTPVRIAIALYTLIALAGIGWTLWLGYKRQAYGNQPRPNDDDTAGDRHRFLGFSTLLLSALSAVATLYSAMVAIFIGSSH